MRNSDNESGASTFISELIRFVCDAYKKRSSGTRSERASLEYFAKILRNYADEVRVERFVFHPSAYKSVLTVGGLMGILSAVLSILAATAGTVRLAGILSFVFMLFSLGLTVAEFVFCRQVFDFMFSRRISKNVYAVRKPIGEVRRRIIFSGHTDAPGELLLGSRSLRRLNQPFLLVYGIGSLVSFVMSTIYLFSGCPPIRAGWVLYPVLLCIFVPFFVFAVFFRRHGSIVEGACSAVAGCAAACAVLKSMADNDERLHNTEVCCLITGGYNSGCRGTNAFVKSHKNELKSIPTRVIPIGSVSGGGHFTVCSLDRCGTIRNDMDCAQMIIMAGRETGIDVAHSDFALRCTDAAAYSAAGISACTIEVGELTVASPSETKADNRKCVSISAIESVLEICLNCAEKYDRISEAETDD